MRAVPIWTFTDMVGGGVSLLLLFTKRHRPSPGKHTLFLAPWQDVSGTKNSLWRRYSVLAHGAVRDEQHTFAAKTRLGIFMGYDIDTDGKFKGDVRVIDAQGLSEAYRAHEFHVIRTQIGEII